METKNSGIAPGEAIKILVVGNNPIELSRMLTRIQKMDNRRVLTEIAFDVQSILDRLSHFRPDYILIDDNIGRPELRLMVKQLLAERKTKNIPITIIKNSNYHEATVTGVMDYVLKENLNPESLYKTFVNYIKLRKTQEYLYKAYKRRKGQLLRIFKKSEPAFQV
jgi:PleD family two-component response regulator